jgi:hypothetical protein
MHPTVGAGVIRNWSITIFPKANGSSVPNEKSSIKKFELRPAGSTTPARTDATAGIYFVRNCYGVPLTGKCLVESL